MATYKDIRYSTPLSNGSSQILLKTITASSSTTLSFTSGIDSTYKEYLFEFSNIHAGTDDKHLTFQTSTDAGSNYGLTLTNTNFSARHQENDGTGSIAYTDNDVAQGTGFAVIAEGLGDENDGCTSGFLQLFNPSDTTFVKHYISKFNLMNFSNPPQSVNYFTAGYFNTTSDIDAIQFKMSGGNIDAGTVKMYGIK